MLIGIIIVGKVYYGFHITILETAKALGLVVVIGFIFETLIMYLYNRIFNGNSDDPK